MLFNPCHPGEILEEYLEGNTVEEFAEMTGISSDRMYLLLNQDTNLTEEDCSSLAKSLGTSEQYWINLRDQYNSFNKVEK